MPNSICEECETNINKLYNFRKTVQHSDWEIKKHLQVLEDSKLATQKPTESQIKKEHNDLEVETREDVVHFVKVEDDKCEPPKQSFVENVPSDLVFDVHDDVDRSSDSDTSVELPPKKASILPKKSNSKPLRTQKYTVSQKRFSCEKCDYTCVGQIALRKHQLSRHYECVSCSICSKLVRRANLSRHIRNHSQGQVCKECGEDFKNFDDLKVHKYEKHKRVELPCNICGKVFHYQGALNRHIKLHCEYLCYFLF